MKTTQLLQLLRANTPDADEIEGTGGDDLLDGLGGDDRIDGLAGDDTLFGGSGDDTLLGRDGNDSLDGSGGRDRLEGGAGDDTLDASGGSVESQGFGDYIRPGLGADTVLGHAGLWNAGNGVDLSYGDLSGIGGLTVTIGTQGTGTAVSGTAGLVGDSFTFIEYFEGSQDGDLINGSDDEPWFGYAPLGGADTVNGGGGYDVIDYSYEAEYFGGTGGPITADLAAGTVVDTQGDTDVISGIEEIRGTPLGDALSAAGVTSSIEFSGGAGDDTITGGSGDDRLRGGPGNDSILGGAGDDTINDNQGLDVVDAGPGIDTYERNLQDDGFAPGQFGDVVVDLGEGLLFGEDFPDDPDVIQNFENVDLQGEQNYRVIGTDDDNRLRTDAGDDTLIGGGGRDRLRAGDGDDLIDASGGSAESQDSGDVASPGLGNDTVVGHEALWDADEGIDVAYSDVEGVGGLTIDVGNDGTGTAVSGTAGLVNDTFTYADFFEGSRDADLINGSDEDRFEGFAPLGGADTVNGGTGGNDQLNYSFELDVFDTQGSGITVDMAAGTVIDTQGDTDVFTGIEQVRGSQMSDTMTAEGMSDGVRFRGEDGNDTLTGGSGDDTLEGGDGNDVAVIAVAEADATITREGGDTTVQSAEGTDVLRGIESIRFTDGTVTLGPPPGQLLVGIDGDDDLVGNEGDDSLFGQEGDDTLDGAGGDDNIGAGPGDDLLRGGEGDDLMGGGTGNDDMDGDGGNDFMGGGQDDDTVDGGDGNDVVNGGPGGDLLIGGAGSDTMGGSFGADTLEGGDGDDDMGGGAGRDVISAGAGDDRVGGGEAADAVDGGAGDDFLAGGGNDDAIDGGEGSDTINGGDGDDSMTGGAGADVFVFNFFKDGDEDVITDFEDGTDQILVRIVNPEDGTENISNGGNGLAGFLAALNITDVDGGAQIAVDGHTVLFEGVAAADLGLDDIQFL